MLNGRLAAVNRKRRETLKNQNSRALSSIPAKWTLNFFKVIIPQKMSMLTGRTSPKTRCSTATINRIKH
ncbi:hypothetical protein AO203_04590 [Lactobacillus gallinarum]|nr:hypothetical protein AO203_04590 [Lactobacillus gallinarum]